MIILRQKIFFSEEFYKTWEKKGRRARRGAFYKTLGNAALGGVKNAGLQTLEAVTHPLTTASNISYGVLGKVGNSITSLGETFGIGKGSKNLTTGERIRRIAHFVSPTARKAINIHDFTAHTLGKSGDSWVDSMARFKYTPLTYVGRKTDEFARTGVLGLASKASNMVGASGVASGLDKAQGFAGGKWAKFDASNAADLVGKSPIGRGIVNVTGKVSGYTIGERPGGFIQGIGDAITEDYKPELEKYIEDFKNTKQARRAAEHLNRSIVIKHANKIAKADKRLWKGIGEGVNTVGQGLSKVKQGISRGGIIGQGETKLGINTARQGINRGLETVGNEARAALSKTKNKTKSVLTGIGSVFKLKKPTITPTLTPIPATI